MVVYSAHIALLASAERTVVLQGGVLIAELVCRFMELYRESEYDERSGGSFELDMEDVRQSRRGDSDAYRRLVERHQNYAGRILWRFSRDKRVHEELVQDVFVEAYLSLHTYHGRAPFAHWLSRIATRVGYRYWKRSDRQHETESFSLEDWDQMVAEETEQADPNRVAALLHSLLGQLPPRDRLTLTLRYLEGCSVAETAHRTGWTKTMVKVQSLRARKKLKKLFEQLGKDTVL